MEIGVVAEPLGNRFQEIVKKARNNRYLHGKIPRDTKMDEGGVLQRKTPQHRDYGFSSNGDPTKTEGMMYENFVTNFLEPIFSNATQDPLDREILGTRFILTVPIKDSSDLFLVDIQAVKFPPDDQRNKSFPATVNKAMVRLSKDDVDYLLGEYKKDPQKVEKFYKSCFPYLDANDSDKEGHSGIQRLSSNRIFIIKDITEPIVEGGNSTVNMFSGANGEDEDRYRRWYRRAVSNPDNNLLLIPESEITEELVIKKDEEPVNGDIAIINETSVENPNTPIIESNDILPHDVNAVIGFQNKMSFLEDQGLPARMANFITSRRQNGEDFDMLFITKSKKEGFKFVSFAPAVTNDSKGIPLYLTVELPDAIVDKLGDYDPNVISEFFSNASKSLSGVKLSNVGRGQVVVDQDLKIKGNSKRFYK